MHCGLKAQCRRHDADTEAKISGRAYRDAILVKEFLHGRLAEQPPIVVTFQSTGGEREFFGVHHALVNAAPRLDGAGDG